jgi:hypothetical protein
MAFFDLAAAAASWTGTARWSSLGGDGRRRRLPAAFATTEGAGGVVGAQQRIKGKFVQRNSQIECVTLLR